jgi:hypothetical protein
MIDGDNTFVSQGNKACLDLSIVDFIHAITKHVPQPLVLLQTWPNVYIYIKNIKKSLNLVFNKLWYMIGIIRKIFESSF